ncbi:MarR family transcriptional regulator [Streptacidiphilus sp. ASG 303]|uniref:MarR family winged helix-turn-helix transcriptional regulator n=1 Tax=Streptacidiphilus sp. ASG 303 TaxID=2896847 RepID=UPI001E5EC2C1|nr:MarR family transcriptional regulator [Streptacidiphilus sp. ASG 303]MCD0484412.1 MarR family transcriptional regulator [Streptacidiphilus sp. ASG 303]
MDPAPPPAPATPEQPDEAHPAGRAGDGGDPQPSLLLKDQFCFTLYAASRALTAAYRPLLEDLGLTYPQYLVMLALWEHGAVPVKDLVDALGLDYGTLTPLLKRLEANHLLTRRRSARDERLVEVAPTPRGVELRTRALAVPPALGDAMRLGADDIAAATAVLGRMTANLARSPLPGADAPR